MKLMSKLILSFLIAGSAFAGGPVGSTGQTQTQTTTQQTASESVASNAGNLQSIIFSSPGVTSAAVTQTVAGETTSRVVYSGTQTVKNVPNVNSPALVSSNDTCMGSVSTSASVPGFGVGFGKTYKDENCVMLKNSRELWNMGMRAAALALMCMDTNNRKALEITGFECPSNKR